MTNVTKWRLKYNGIRALGDTGEDCLKRRDGPGEKWGSFQAKGSATTLQDRGRRNDGQEEVLY